MPVDETNVIANVKADLARGTVDPYQVSCTQYDAEMRRIAVHMQQNGKIWNIPVGYSVNVRMKKADGTVVYNPGEADENIAYITLSGQMCILPGRQDFVVEIIKGDDVVQTAPIRLEVIANPMQDGDEASADEKETIQGLVEDAQSAAEESQTNADQAYTWAQNTLTLFHQTEDLTQQVEQTAQKIFGVDVKVEVVTQSQYEALNPPDPKTVYIVTGDNPNPYLKAYYPMTADVADMLSEKAGSIVGSGSFSGDGLRTAPSGTVSQHKNYIQLPDDLFDGLDIQSTSGLTVAIDVMPDTTSAAGNGDWVRLFNFYKPADTPAGTAEGELYLTQGCIGTAFYGGTTIQALDASKAGAIATGSWHTVALAVAPFASGVSVYVDGVIQVSISGSTSALLEQIENFTKNRIGDSRFANNDFVGLVRNLRVYNKVLTVTEIGNIGTAPAWSIYYGGAKMDDLIKLQEKVEGIIGGTVDIQTIRGAYGQDMDIGPASIGDMSVGPTASGGTLTLRGTTVRLAGQSHGQDQADNSRLTGVAAPTADNDAVPKGWADGRYTPLTAAIRPTVTGNPIHVEDSAEAPVLGLCVYGRTEQATTTGAQLFDAETVLASKIERGEVTVTADGIILNGTFNSNNRGFNITLEAGTYYFSESSNTLHKLTPQDSVWNSAITFEEQTTVRCYIASGTYNNKLITPMLNAGSTALPWEPYTGGQPSPSPEYPQELVSAGDVSVTLSDGGETSQTLTLTGGLPGIPVDSGGNYTDADGQQWACNYRDWARGVDVQIVGKRTLSSNDNPSSVVTSYDSCDVLLFNMPYTIKPQGAGYKNTFCNKFRELGDDGFNGGPYQMSINGSQAYFSVEKGVRTVPDETEFLYLLAKPTETPIPAEELAAYKALQTYDGTTNVTATDGAGLSLRYVADTQKYIDAKIAVISAAMLEG